MVNGTVNLSGTTLQASTTTFSSTVGTVYQSMSAGFLLTEVLIPLVMDAIGEPARTRMALWEERRRNEVLP